MSKKYSSWASIPRSSSLKTDMIIKALTTVNGDDEDQCKNLERVEASPHLYLNVDAPPPTLSTESDDQITRPVVISKQSASFFAAPTTIPPPTTNSEKKFWPIENSFKDSSFTKTVPSTPKRNRRNKHHHHKEKHHHHHTEKHHHHRHHHNHNRRHQSKNSGQEDKTDSPSKNLVKNSPPTEHDSQQQQPIIVYRQVPNNESYAVNTNTSANVLYGTDQQTPLVVYRSTDAQQPIVTDNNSQPIFLNRDQEIIPSTGAIPLQSIENKLVSHRVASANETQVGNYPTIISPQSIPSIINTGMDPQFEQIYIDGDCSCSNCCSSSTMNCVQDPSIIQQSDPVYCLPQQQQQEILICEQPAAQNMLCTVPQQQQQVLICEQPAVQNMLCTVPQQQQYICVETTPSTAIQPAIINQMPVFLQQPTQMQPQPGQYLQISSATPQIIQTVQVPPGQPQSMMQGSPQLLYQRPYDPIIIPAQNQQFSIATNPIGLSQPSYAPPRVAFGGQQRQMAPGPYMFRQALARTVANRTGLPVSPMYTGGLQSGQAPMIGPSRGIQLGSTARDLLINGLKPSPSVPIVPLTPGGLLIPFQLSEPPETIGRGTLPRTGGNSLNDRYFHNIRQQIQRRAQLLADLQRENSNRIPTFPVNSAKAPVLRPPPFSSNVLISPPVASSSIPQPTPTFSSTTQPLRPSVFTSQIPYTSGNNPSTSSSGSSKSSVSSIAPAPFARLPSTGLVNPQPSLVNPGAQSTFSGPSARYQSFRP